MVRLVSLASRMTMMEIYLSVFEAVLQKSTPTQIREHVLYFDQYDA